MASDEHQDALNKVRDYRKLVLLYEAIDFEIDTLIMQHGGGGSDSMSEEERTRYRHLAQKRDEVQNEMRLLEQQLQLDDDED